MKYLKLYESFENVSIQDWIDKQWGGKIPDNDEIFSCNNQELTTLKGIEKLKNIKEFRLAYNKFENLKGFEHLINTTQIDLIGNKLTNLKGIENLINLNWLSVWKNKLSNLKGVENLVNLETLYCGENKLKNLNEIKHLNNLDSLPVCVKNPWEFPLPLELTQKFNITYDEINKLHFKTYESQKKFITKYPEKINDLKPFGIHEKIKEEFADIIEGNEFGFFGLK